MIEGNVEAREGFAWCAPAEDMDNHDAVESSNGDYGDVGRADSNRPRQRRYDRMDGEGQRADYRYRHDASGNTRSYDHTGHHGVQADDRGASDNRGRGHQNLHRQGSYGSGRRFGRAHSSNGGYRQHGRNRSNSGNYHDGRDRSSSGNHFNDGRNRSNAGSHRDNNRKNHEMDYMDPDRMVPQVVPPNFRRTLIFSNIHPDIRHGQIKRHFEYSWRVKVQHVSIFTDKQESYVKFKNVDDAMAIWRAGNDGLDGQYGVEEGQFSFVKEGIQLKDVYLSNCVPDESPRRRTAQGQTPYPDQQSNKAAKYGHNSDGPGGRSHPDEYRDESDHQKYQKSPPTGRIILTIAIIHPCKSRRRRKRK